MINTASAMAIVNAGTPERERYGGCPSDDVLVDVGSTSADASSVIDGRSRRPSPRRASSPTGWLRGVHGELAGRTRVSSRSDRSTTGRALIRYRRSSDGPVRTG